MTTYDASQNPISHDSTWSRRALSDAANFSAGQSAIKVVEGPRGLSIRATVILRYALYMLAIMICAGTTQGMLATMPEVSNGGMWMLFSATLTLFTAAAGCAFYVNQRKEIIEQCRHFLFGIMLFPGTGLAVLMWATRGVVTSSTSSSVLSSTFQNALPLVFFATVIIPALIFVKMIAGMRNLHRSRLDDQEAIALWTRQDNLVR
jgi:hypothetical protein